MRAYKTKLKNGLKFITVPMKDTSTVTALVMVEAGSKYEDKENNGISHFLEHMCFQGTENRPEVGQISYELESIGAEHNAFTGEEYTGYYAKGHSKHSQKIIELVADLYSNPIFPADAIEREKGVIIEELNMYEDLPQRRVIENLQNLLYKGQPAGFDIIGTKKNIKKFKRDDFTSYREKHYVPQATTVVVAGNIDSRFVKKQIEGLFGRLKRSKKFGKKEVKESQKSPEVSIKSKKTDQSHIAIGIRAFDIHDKHSKTLDLMSVILGQGLSSRLFRRMRNELGMCYYSKAFTDLYTDHGYFGLRAGVGHKRTLEAIEVMMDEVRKLKEEVIPKDELKKAKNLMIGKMYLGLEPSDDIAVYYGLRETLGLKTKNPKEKEKEIRGIEASDIQKVAKEVFKNKNLNLALIGPFGKKDEKRIKKVLRV